MSTQAYYKERLGFDPADTVAEHQREQRSQHGYEESLSKFKGQNTTNGFPDTVPGCNGDIGIQRTGNSQAFWGCWAMFIEAHGRWKEREREGEIKRVILKELACRMLDKVFVRAHPLKQTFFFVYLVLFFIFVCFFPPCAFCHITFYYPFFYLSFTASVVGHINEIQIIDLCQLVIGQIYTFGGINQI